MKVSRHLFVGLVTSLAVVLLLGVAAPPVLHAKTHLGLKIPFEFYVGNQQFAPGDYTVVVTGAYIKVSDTNGHSVFVLTDPIKKPERMNVGSGLLVFTHYYNTYFLSEVWREGQSAGNELKKTALELQIARSSINRGPIALRAGR